MFQLYVIGISNQKITIDMGDELASFQATTIYEFKKMLLSKTQLSMEPDQMRLLFAGKQLENGKKISDYDIEDKSSIMLVIRVPGGCYQMI